MTAQFTEDFTTLDLVTPDNPNGRWRANDLWQGWDGYNDFGAGGQSTFCVNPNQKLADGRHSQFSVADSVLSLKASRNKSKLATGAPWLGCILISNTARDDCTFTYGYFEFKMRLPVHGKGMFPALWMFSAQGKNDAANKGHAEIDLLEVFGYNGGSPWNVTVHEKDNNGGGAAKAQYTGNDDTTGWHTYAIEWTKDVLRFYKDDKLVKDSSSEAPWFRDVKMSMRLNYAMDAGWFPGNQRSDGSTPDELRMEVDYVKVWASKSAHDADAAPVAPPIVVPPVVPTSPTSTGGNTRPPNDQVVELPKVFAGYGFSDNITKSVQALLTVRGFTTTPSAVWTAQTTAQLRLFQAAKKLPVTGVVDAGTWSRLLYG